MKFFFSGEIDTLVAEAYAATRKSVEGSLTAALGARDYGPAIREIAIIPMILRPDWQEGHRERRLFQRKEASADYRTWIDFQRFTEGDERERTRLLVKNLVEAITDLSRKAGSGFSGDLLVADVMNTFSFSREEIGCP